LERAAQWDWTASAYDDFPLRCLFSLGAMYMEFCDEPCTCTLTVIVILIFILSLAPDFEDELELIFCAVSALELIGCIAYAIAGCKFLLFRGDDCFDSHGGLVIP
jgi:hypothetical protein